MFFRPRSNTAVIPASAPTPVREVAPVPKPSPVPLSGAPPISVAYTELAKTLKFSPLALTRSKFELVLLDLNQPMFPFEQVSTYLQAMAPADCLVTWMPLTASDWEAAHVILPCSCSSDTHWTTLNVRLGKRPYARLIPGEVLERVLAIRRSITPEQVPFFVSDFAAPKPDPFLLALFSDSDVMVFDAWDEPGFGSVTK